MIRVLAILFLVCFVCLLGWVIPPSDDEEF